jgi:prolyl 4-hydroxylase
LIGIREGASQQLGWINVAVIGALVVGALLLIHRLWVRRNRRHYHVQEFPDFLTGAECDHIIERAAPHLKQSEVLAKSKGSSKSIVRSSESGFIPQRGDSVLRSIKRKIAVLSERPVDHQEMLQVTHYYPHTFYSPHLDALPASDPGVAAGNNRESTVLIYLNDDYTGGATRFPRIGVSVVPKRGKAVLFTNLKPDGRPNTIAQHEAKIVLSGEKWVVNQWIRQEVFQKKTTQPIVAGQHLAKKRRR